MEIVVAGFLACGLPKDMSCDVVSLSSCPASPSRRMKLTIFRRAHESACHPAQFICKYRRSGRLSILRVMSEWWWWWCCCEIVWWMVVSLRSALGFGGGSSAWELIDWKSTMSRTSDFLRPDSSQIALRNTFLMRCSLVDSGEAVVTPIRSIYLSH